MAIGRGTEAIGEEGECLVKICELSARVYWFFSDDKEDLCLGHDLRVSPESLRCSIRRPCMWTEVSEAFLAIYRVYTKNTISFHSSAPLEDYSRIWAFNTAFAEASRQSLRLKIL